MTALATPTRPCAPGELDLVEVVSLSAPRLPQFLQLADDSEPTQDSFDRAITREFGSPNQVDAAAIPPSLYSVLVFERASMRLVGSYGLESGELESDRAAAIDAAARDSGLPPAALLTAEEWR